MKNSFSPLERDDDILLINQDTFTVRRFKELLERAISTKLKNTFDEYRSILFTTNFFTFSINDEVNLLLNDIQWCNSPINCQLLQVGSQGWQKGKLKIQMDTKILFPRESNKIHIRIEFCPDEPTASESPLDDLRQLPEYKQQNPKAP